MKISEIEELIHIGRYDEAETALDQLDKNVETFLLYAFLYSISGDFHKEEEYALRVLDSEGATDYQWISANNHLGWAKFRLGQYDQAESFALASMAKIETMAQAEDLEVRYSDLLNLRGSICAERGNLKNAEEFYRKSLNLRIEHPGIKERDLAGSYNNLAFVQQKMGNMIDALANYQKALEIFNKLGHLEGMTVVKSNIAEIYRIRAEIDKSLELHKEVLKLREDLGNTYGLAQSHRYVAVLDMELGNFDDAEYHFTQSLNFWDEVGNTQWKSATLLNYGKLLLKQKKTAKKIVSELHDLWLETNIGVIKHRYYLMKALDLKAVPRMSTIADAQTYLERIIRDEVLDFEVTYDALIQQCDILFQELKISDDISLYNEAKVLLSQLEKLARENNAYAKLMEVLFLKSKMALIDGDFERADALLTQTELLVEENRMYSLRDAIKLQRRNMKQDISRLNQIILDNNDVIERAKLLRLTEYLDDASRIAKSERDRLDQS